MSEKKANICIAFLAGVIVGGVAALLLAPASGEDVRKKIKDELEEVREKIKEETQLL